MNGKSGPARVSLIGILAMMTGMLGLIGGMVTLLLSFLQFDLFGFSPSNSTAVGFGVMLGLVLIVLGILWMVAGGKPCNSQPRIPTVRCQLRSLAG